MSGSWTVREVCTPLAEPNGREPALVDGNSFSFRRGEPLERDDNKTVSEEKNGVIIRQWFWLSLGDRAGFVPHNPLNAEDIRSPAIELTDAIPPPAPFQLFDKTIPLELFAENCVRKAIRWDTNGAYLFALAFVESGDDWPDNEVSSPEGTTTVGTFRFLPQTWQTLVDKLGSEQNIAMQDIVFPEPQTTFAASQAGDSSIELKMRIGSPPRFEQLYLAHLFTIEGAVALSKLNAADLARPLDEVLREILEDLGPETIEARVDSLIKRKAKILTNGTSTLNAMDGLRALSRELDRGFDKVRQVADALIPVAPSAGNTSRNESPTAGTLGVLSEEFESNGDAGAVGWDRVGRWSYGRYQISTAKNRFVEFMTFLHKSFPAIAETLDNAGGAEAAKAGSEAFKRVFRSLKEGKDFSQAQHDFIKVTHFDVMVRRLAGVLNVNARSFAIQNVVWSVAVQHGPQSYIITKVITPANENDDAALINAVYDERSKVNIYFSNSTPEVRKSVLNRFKRERLVALRMIS